MDGVLLSHADFHSICAGPVTDDVMRTLRRSQYSRRRLVLRALLDQARVGLRWGDDAERSWAVLAEAETAAPDVVEEVLMSPAVGLWLNRALRRTAAGSDEWSDIAVLHAVAAAAAVRLGIPCTIAVPVAHGVVTLPTVGQYEVARDVDSVELACAGPARPVLIDGSETTFRPFRRHRSTAGGRSWEVTVDDMDPHRGFAAPEVPDPLGDAEYDRWRTLVDEAWSLLTRWEVDYAAELTAGLISLVPLPDDSGVVGASSATAFGAVALTASGPTEFAEALVHELQHSKLNAVLELVALHEADESERFYAPWRDDARPLTGVLHGIYAFACVVEFWVAMAPGSFTPALRARQVRRAIDGLDRTRLTDRGLHLVEVLSHRLAVCERELASSEHSDLVDRIIRDHYATWRISHVRPCAADVAALADAWPDRLPVPVGTRGDVVAVDVVATSPRIPLLKMRALDRDGFAGLPRRGADAAYADDDLDAAASGYLDRLAIDPDDGHAWVGLGLALHEPALIERPEVVRAVHREVAVRTGAAPDPRSLARWLAR